MPNEERQAVIGQTRVLLYCPAHGWQWVSLGDTMMIGPLGAPFGVCWCGHLCPLIARYGVTIARESLS